MKTLLFTWLGMTDLRVAGDSVSDGDGPIGQAVKQKTFDEVIILSDHSVKNEVMYQKWLSSECGGCPTIYKVKLSSPTDFGDIYEAASQAIVDSIAKHGQDSQLVFHLSPGTPAMAAVWIILSKTRFPANLIESSQEHGVRTVSVPFDISADYIPDLLRKPDEDVLRITMGLQPSAPEFDGIIHRCSAMKRLISQSRHVAPRDLPVLIMGESGTGKELLAQAIHQTSTRKNGPFISVNCGAIPSELLESELFGHKKGAFTGATENRVGHIESASGGTLFLDEIGELPLHAQVRLLRVIQEREVVRVGETKARKADFRIVAATNRNLIEDVGAGKFRADLFHRIAVAILNIPALRDRPSDIGLLIDHFVEQINEEARNQPGHKHKKISASARNLLSRHPWPGNIRELQNTLQRLILWSLGDRITARDAKEAILPMQSSQEDVILGRPLGKGLDLQELMGTVASSYLKRAIQETHGNKTKSAEIVGLPNYQTFTNWMKKYGVSEK